MINQHKIFPFLLVLFEIATYLSSDMYLPALPEVIHSFVITHSQAQWTLTAWFLGSISVQLLLGPLTDAYGRKTVLCWGGVFFIVATLSCALAPRYSVLLMARFFQGMGICFMAVPGYAAIHESYEQREAIKIIALMGSFAVLAPALGPLLGSLILLELSWRWIFGFLVGWSLISVSFLFLWMPETLAPPQRSPLRWLQALRIYWDIVLNKRFMKLMLVNGLIFCGFICWIVMGPFLVMYWFKQSALSFGSYQALIFASLIFGNYCLKKQVDRKDPRKLIRFGLALCLAATSFAVIFYYVEPSTSWGIILSYVVYAFGSAFTFSPLNRLAIEASEQGMGARMAVFSMLMSGFATLSSVMGLVFYQGTALSFAWIILGTVALACGVERLL